MEFHLAHALIRKLCKLTTPVTIDEETAKICAENSEMFKHVSLAKDVFKTPEMTFKEVTDYKIKPMYINLFNNKVRIQIPEKYVCYDVYKDVSYSYSYGEFRVYTLPYALFVRCGKVYECRFTLPKTEVTSLENYFISILEYCEGHGSHAHNLGKTVEHLGKFSIGIPFGNGYNIEVRNGNVMVYPNSQHFVVDRSYIVPEKLKEYDLACKRYNQNESPFII